MAAGKQQQICQVTIVFPACTTAMLKHGKNFSNRLNIISAVGGLAVAVAG